MAVRGWCVLFILGMSAIAMSVDVFEKLSNKDISFMCTQTPTNWYYTPDGGASSLLTDALTSANFLTLLTLAPSDEGLYTCVNGGTTVKSFNLTVLALAKFAECQPIQQDCDLGSEFTLAEGEPIVVNISVDFYGGGSRNEKQAIHFIFLKNPNGKTIASCPWGKNCIDADQSKSITFPIMEPFSKQILINDATVNDSGVYKVELEVDEGSGIAGSVVSVFTVVITSTSATTTAATTATTTIIPTTTTAATTTTTITTSISSTVDLISKTPLSTSASNYFSKTISSESLHYSHLPTVTSVSSSNSQLSTDTVLFSTSSSVSPLIDGTATENKGDTLEDGYIVLIAVIGLIIIIGSVVAIGVCIVSRRRRSGTKSLSITFISQWIFGNNKNSEVVIDNCQTDFKESGVYNSTSTDGTYSNIQQISKGTEIICTDSGVYAKVTTQLTTLSPTPNSEKRLV